MKKRIECSTEDSMVFLPFEVKDTREIPAVYGNWKAAEEALELYNGERNVTLSY